MQTSYATPPSISATSISPSLRHQHEHQQRQSHRFGSQTPSPQYQHAAALSAPVAPQARLAPSPRGLPQDLESALWSGGTNGSIASLTPPGTPPPWSRSSRTSDQHLTSAETTASPRPFIPPPQPYLAEFSPTDSGIGSSKGSGPHPISTSQSSSQHSQIQFRQSSSTSISNVSGSGSSFSSSPSPSSYHHTTLSRRFILAFVVSGVCLGIPLFFLDRRQWPQRRSPATLRHGPRHSGSLFIFAVLVNLVVCGAFWPNIDDRDCDKGCLKGCCAFVRVHNLC